MPNIQQAPREQIFEAACKVFLNKGYDDTRMKEIAHEAGFNTSMLYYYYQSKQRLFQEVFNTEIHHFFSCILEPLKSDESFDRKISQLIDDCHEILQDNPHLGHFIFLEMVYHAEEFQELTDKLNIAPLRDFETQYRLQIRNNGKVHISAKQFVINLLAIILFPFSAKNMIKAILNLDETGYLSLMRNRRDSLAEFIVKSVCRDNQ